MQFNFSQKGSNNKNLILPIFEGNTSLKELPVEIQSFIESALKEEKNFKGKTGETLVLRNSIGCEKIIFLGLGKEKKLNDKQASKIGISLKKTLSSEKIDSVEFYADTLDANFTAQLANSMLSETYAFNKYKSNKKEQKQTTINFYTQSPKCSENIFNTLKQTTESVFWASDLANEPGNVLNPETYAERIQKELRPLGIKVSILDHFEMKKQGMGAALAVGQGSKTPPCMVVMEYDGSQGSLKKPLALVGKGITFDSGGLSLKRSAGMGDMTLDMGGSAAVVGAMRALAARKSTAHVVSIVALAENMPDSLACRPGDIVTSMSGKTIHIGNTDAEGRLVLADAMTYIQKTFNPHTVVDLATLTGAAISALGKEFAAVLGNDSKLWKKFNIASKKCGEKIWRMPLMETDTFKKTMRNTPLADLTNSASGAGTCNAAAFLHEFIEKTKNDIDKCKWMHIDMAGPGMGKGIKKGWGVLLLDQLIKDNFETTPPKKNVKKCSCCQKP